MAKPIGWRTLRRHGAEFNRVKVGDVAAKP